MASRKTQVHLLVKCPENITLGNKPKNKTNTNVQIGAQGLDNEKAPDSFKKKKKTTCTEGAGVKENLPQTHSSRNFNLSRVYALIPGTKMQDN